MPTPDTPSEGPFSPDDPRYESWLIMRGFLQSETSAARSEFFATFQRTGAIELSDVLKLIGRSFDSLARTLVLIVTGVVSAELCARDLDDLLVQFLKDWRPFYPTIVRLTGLTPNRLETEIRLDLASRQEAWKTQAFRLGTETEVKRIRDVPQSHPGPKETSIAAAPLAETIDVNAPAKIGAIDEKARRQQLLREYKAATSNPSNRRIYTARNSEIHKPQFYEWLEGRLPASSATAQNFERFLREKKQPVPRKPKP